MKCPRCNINDLEKPQVRNALSRRDNKTYICSPCGTEEAMFDLSRSETEVPVETITKEREWLEVIAFKPKLDKLDDLSCFQTTICRWCEFIVGVDDEAFKEHLLRNHFDEMKDEFEW